MLTRLFWILRALIAQLLLISATAAANVGSITDLKGQGEVVRSQKKMTATPRLPIAMKDTVRTGNGRIQITFQDNSMVKVTEQSRLVIDDFVYDSKTNGGKMGIRFASGTARFIGGKMNRPNIKLNTPTATIGVRGTDFTASVSETGKSMFILLPGDDGHVGEITVSTDAGIVVLNQAFQSTTVITSDAAPSRPVILDISLSLIDNMIMVSPPPVVDTGEPQSESQSVEEAMFELNQNFLQDDSLDKDNLNSSQSDELGQSFFDDVSVDAGKAVARIAPPAPSVPQPAPPAVVIPQQTVAPAPAPAAVEVPTLQPPPAEVPVTPPAEDPISTPPPEPVDIPDVTETESDLPPDDLVEEPEEEVITDGSYTLEGTALGFDLSTKFDTTILANRIRFYRNFEGIVSVKTTLQNSINMTVTNDVKTHNIILNNGSTSLKIIQKK